MTNDEPLEAIPVNSEATPEPGSEGVTIRRAKTGGRQKGSTAARLLAAKDIALKNNFRGLEEMIKIFQTGKLPTAPGMVTQNASATARLRCLEQACGYLYPRLSTQQIVGANDGPIAVATLDVNKLVHSPELAAMAQKLALSLSGYPSEPLQIESGADEK